MVEGAEGLEDEDFDDFEDTDLVEGAKGLEDEDFDDFEDTDLVEGAEDLEDEDFDDFEDTEFVESEKNLEAPPSKNLEYESSKSSQQQVQENIKGQKNQSKIKESQKVRSAKEGLLVQLPQKNDQIKAFLKGIDHARNFFAINPHVSIKSFIKDDIFREIYLNKMDRSTKRYQYYFLKALQDHNRRFGEPKKSGLDLATQMTREKIDSFLRESQLKSKLARRLAGNYFRTSPEFKRSVVHKGVVKLMGSSDDLLSSSSPVRVPAEKPKDSSKDSSEEGSNDEDPKGNFSKESFNPQ